MSSIKNEFLNSNIKNDLLSGFMVALVIIPEIIVFSTIIGISFQVALYTACILCLVMGLIGGKSGSIAGLTGTIAVIFLSLSIELKQSLPSDILHKAITNDELPILILQYILVATFLAGVIQILFGIFKCAKYIRLIPNYVIFGLINGLAIMAVIAQFYTFKSEEFIYYILVIITFLIVFFLPKFSKSIPSSFVALIVVTPIVLFFDIDTKTIGDLADVSVSALPTISIPKLYLSFEGFFVLIPYALLIALVSSIESLITINTIEEMHQEQGNPSKELLAIGTGNVLCSFLGSTAGSSMLSQSVFNFNNGGLGRFSTLFVSVFLIFFMYSLSSYISMMPLGILIGILISIPFFLFEWQNNYYIKDFTKREKIALIMIATVTIFVSLEIAFVLSVIIGFILYVSKLFVVTSRVHTVKGEKTYELFGPLHLYNANTFLRLFDIKNDPKQVVIDFKNLRVIDQKAIDAIDKIALMYKDNGIILRIKYLSNHCKNNSKEAKFYCEYNEDDPIYKVAINK